MIYRRWAASTNRDALMMIHHRSELKLQTMNRLVDQEEIHLQQFFKGCFSPFEVSSSLFNAMLSSRPLTEN